MTIGQRIAELRKKNNLSQEALGEELGVSRQAISKWEADASLPEIDKLIAMSRLFAVTVGYLLGVEETVRDAEPSEPEDGEAPADAAPTEAEVLERYLNSLPRSNPSAKRRMYLIVAVLILVLVIAFNCIRSLSSRVAELNNQVVNLNNQVVGVYSELNGISDSVTAQVRSALEEEYGVFSAQELALDSTDFEAGTADILFTAVLKERMEDAAGLSFFARLPDGQSVPGTVERWDPDTSSLSARVTVPLVNGISYFLSTPSATVSVDTDYSGTDALWDWLGVSGFGGAVSLDNSAALTPELSIGAAVKKTERFDAEVSLWLVLNGERVAQFDNVRLTEKDVSEGAAVDVTSEYKTVYQDYTADPLDLNGFDPQPGDLIAVAYEVTLTDGRTGSGWLMDGYRITEDGFPNSVWINEETGFVEMEW